MWKLLFAVLIAFAIWKFYPAIMGFDMDKLNKDAVGGIKQEKTIFNVNETRKEQAKDVQNALNN